jgi:membrane associated rhomboid family serine protease
MDYDTITFWFVCLSCISGLVMAATRLRSVGAGWVVLYLTILIIAIIGWLWERNVLVYGALGMWLLFVLVPGLLGRKYYRLFLQQRYVAAYRLARVISWLHPTDGWRQQPEIIRALELAQKGDLEAASEMLKRFQGIKSVLGLAAVTNLFRITNQWEELLAWQARNSQEVERHPQMLPVLLRAHGETGDLNGMAGLYQRSKSHIAKLAPAESRDLCRLILFAFCGKRALAERLFAGSLAILPASTRDFWLATADLASGAIEPAKRELERLLPDADPSMRRAIERRLSRLSIPPTPLGESAESAIASAAVEHGHDESFGASRSLFSKHARVTQLLIVLNILMFVGEVFLGGSTSVEALYRLGALVPSAVRAGEWWRLVTSLFLHFGPLHLAMNMFALWLLAPFCEFALGPRKFLLVYLLAGVGSMAVVMAFGSGPNGEQITVGASGSVMGLVGATAGLMLRGWLWQKALSAKRRLLAMFIIIATQTVFDALVPQVSMTAHLSGAAIGFLAAIILPDGLRRWLSSRS